MSDTPNPLWQVGASVFDEFGKEHKIAKVYKNGNVVLEGNPDQQWRPWKYQAEATGEGKWSRAVIYANMPANRANAEKKVARAIAQNVIRVEADRLTNLWREGSRAHDAIIAEAARISARKDQPNG